MTDDRNAKDLRALLSSVEAAGWDYARIEIDGLTVVVSREDEALNVTTSVVEGTRSTPAAAPVPAPAPAAAPAAGAEPAVSPSGPAALEVSGEVNTVCSPSIGLYWRSPKPEAPPFVELGQAVTADDTVCIVEVMKLMTHVKAGQDGIVVRIHPANGDMVEFGSPLVDISPAQ
jgi:acetyl-CoA carboxylase biotin carboxyl carrier protein